MLLAIWELISKHLPRVLELLAGKTDKKLAGKKRFHLNQREYDYLKYLVGVRYNQKKYKYGALDEYSGEPGVGLASYVKKAQQKVIDRPTLLPTQSLLKAFIKQNPERAAKSLCNTVIRYIYMETVGVDLPGFVDFYLHCVANGYIVTDSNKDFCWVADSRSMIGDYMRNPEAWEYADKSPFLKNDELIEGFREKKLKVALFRKGNSTRSTHTYLVGKFEGRLVMFDTYHAHYTGSKVEARHPKPDRLWFTYGY